jgi:hypothetical protein
MNPTDLAIKNCDTCAPPEMKLNEICGMNFALNLSDAWNIPNRLEFSYYLYEMSDMEYEMSDMEYEMSDLKNNIV